MAREPVPQEPSGHGREFSLHLSFWIVGQTAAPRCTICHRGGALAGICWNSETCVSCGPLCLLWVKVIIDIKPETTVARLLRAIPSAADVLRNFGIQASPAEERSLQEVCNGHGIPYQQVLQALDELDWNEEFPGPSILSPDD